MSTVKVEITVNTDNLAEAFAEWRRRYEADPDAFMSEMEQRAAGANSYGQMCVDYLLSLLAEQQPTT